MRTLDLGTEGWEETSWDIKHTVLLPAKYFCNTGTPFVEDCYIAPVDLARFTGHIRLYKEVDGKWFRRSYDIDSGRWTLEEKIMGLNRRG